MPLEEPPVVQFEFIHSARQKPTSTMSVKDLQNLISPKLTEAVILDFAAKASGLRNIQIKDVKIGEPPKKGESCGGIITRFSLNLTVLSPGGEARSHFLPVIAKSLPSGFGCRKTMRSVDFFKNEVAFYESVWPAMDNFQKGAAKKFDGVPQVLSAFADGTDDYIAMVDLSYQNYKVGPKFDRLNREHATLGLRMFAEFHALSLAFKDQRPEAFGKAAGRLEETLFDESYRRWYGPFQQNLYAVAKDAVEKELPPLYLKKLKECGDDDLFGSMCKLCRVQGPLAVITHGDIWLPNVLIKYQEESDKPEKIVMIDFPTARYTTLSHDLIMFFFACINHTVLEKHWDELIIEYHKALGDALERFGSDRNLVSLKDIQDDIKLKTPFGIGFAIDALTFSLVDDEDANDIQQLDGDEAVPMEELLVVKPFKRQEQREHFAGVIKFIVDKGLL